MNTGSPVSPKLELHTNWMMVSLFFFTWWHASPPLRFKYKTPSSKYRRLLAFPALYTCFPTCWQTPDLLLQPWKEENHYTVSLNILGSRVGAVVRAPASHHVARVRFRPGAMCRLSLWLFLALFWRFFFGFSGFPPSIPSNISKFQFDQDIEPAWQPDKAVYVASSINTVKHPVATISL